jgi:hypothetical protein
MSEQKPADDALPPELAKIAQFTELIAASYSMARQAYDEEHGQLIPAPSGWSLAVYGDGQIKSLAVIAFRIGPDSSLRQAITCEGYDLRFAALVDPASNRFVAMDSGRIYADQSAWVLAMQALAAYESAEASEATTAH